MKICLNGDRAEALRSQVRAVLDAEGAEGEIVVLDSEGRFDGDPEGIDVVLFSLGVTKHPPAMGPLMSLFDAPGLRWLQGPGAGIDHPIWQKLLDRGVRLTNASGIHGEPIAQYVFAYVLYWERNLARHLAQQRERRWEIIRSGDLTGKTLGIVGYGGIGRAAGRIARAFGMRVIGTRRTEVEDEILDRFVPRDALLELVEAADYLLLCMPLSDETRGMIGARELAAMRPDAVLVNVARGGVVDEPALVRALESRAIRGATLDVFATEPLPNDSPLWSLENCVVTPHDAGYSPLGDDRLGALFLENLRCFVRGERMRNEIDATGLT